MISTYTELVDAVVDWSHRSDMATRIDNFIALCESDMQVRCKLQEFEGSTSITITSGVGSLPAGYSGTRSLYWNGDLRRPLKYIVPDLLDEKLNGAGIPQFYTTSGTEILVAPSGDGTAVMRYKARFTALTATDPTNVLLTNYPDAYLHGVLVQLHTFCNNDQALAKASSLYEAAIERIKTDNRDKRYSGVALEVRAR